MDTPIHSGSLVDRAHENRNNNKPSEREGENSNIKAYLSGIKFASRTQIQKLGILDVQPTVCLEGLRSSPASIAERRTQLSSRSSASQRSLSMAASLQCMHTDPGSTQRGQPD